MTTVYEIDPCTDARWFDFVRRHEAASAFHHPGWLSALRSTYGYVPLAFTTSRPGEALTNGWTFCRVRSPFTGRRLVSLPFSDCAEPLLSAAGEGRALLEHALRRAEELRCRYLEVRPASAFEWMSEVGLAESRRELLHDLDLQPSIDTIHAAFHDSSIKRKIRRAEREGLRYEVGASEALVSAFYRLNVMTRRKHGLPPQPPEWFRALFDQLRDVVRVHVAYKDAQPAAAIVTLAFGSVYIYKYGASDPDATNLGGTPMLFWNAIQEAKAAGYRRFDMGRTDANQKGLATFKERWGARARPLIYYRSPPPARLETEPDESGALLRLARPLMVRLPDSMLILAGRLLYRHAG